jgi:hypothetical protein
VGKFIISDYVADLDTASTREMRIHPSYASGKDVVACIKIASTVSVKAELFEGTSKQHVVGNVVVAIALDRNISELSALEACHTPSAGADGTLLWSGISSSGLELELENLRLERGEAYLLRITALSDNNSLNISVETEEEVFGDTATSVSSSSSSSSCRSSSSSSSAA